MTEAEKNEIVGLVMTEISSQAVDFDIATEQPQANDLLTAVRQTSSGAYVGVTLKWDDVARIATEVANRAAERAEQAETDANNILEQVQSKGTEITNFVATSKTEIETQKNESVEEVRTVYQGDLNELKGDTDYLKKTIGGEFKTYLEFVPGNIDIEGNDPINIDNRFRRCGRIDITVFNDATIIYNNSSTSGYYAYCYSDTEYIDKVAISSDKKISEIVEKYPDTVAIRIALYTPNLPNDVYIIDNVDGLSDTVETLISDTIPSIENRLKRNSVIFKKGMPCSEKTFLNETTGVESAANNYDTSPFFEIKKNTEYIIISGRAVHLYDSKMVWLGCDKVVTTAVDDISTYVLSNEKAVYARLVCYNALTVNVYGIAEKNQRNEVLFLGDSIIGLQPDIFDIPSRVQDYIGIECGNCGYGGTVACTHGNANYDKFSLHSLADAIYNNDFSVQKTAGNISRYYSRSTDVLEQADFTTVKMICIAYGTNDWNYGNDIDNSDNKYSVSTYCGAIRYSIEKIMSKYPHIRIGLMSPLFRMLNDLPVDGQVNSKGSTLLDFCNALRGVAVEYHLPYFDHYNIGINSLNHSAFLRDGAHPTYTDGVDLLGAVFANDISSVLR